MIETSRPRVVFIDLTAGELATGSAIVGYLRWLAPTHGLSLLARTSRQRPLAMAKDAGCHLVMPRSKFAAELLAVLHRCYGQPAESRG